MWELVHHDVVVSCDMIVPYSTYLVCRFVLGTKERVRVRKEVPYIRIRKMIVLWPPYRTIPLGTLVAADLMLMRTTYTLKDRLTTSQPHISHVMLRTTLMCSVCRNDTHRWPNEAKWPYLIIHLTFASAGLPWRCTRIIPSIMPSSKVYCSYRSSTRQWRRWPDDEDSSLTSQSLFSIPSMNRMPREKNGNGTLPLRYCLQYLAP